MMPLNRRGMLQLSAACGLSTAIGEEAISEQALAADSVIAPSGAITNSDENVLDVGP